MRKNQTRSPQQQQPGFVQSMLDASMNGILLLEPVLDAGGILTDFTVIAANRAIAEHVGIEVKDAVNVKMSDLFPRYRECGFFNVYITAFATRMLQRTELLYKDDRIEGWYDLGVATNENLIVVTFTNVTEQKLYHEQIEKSAKRLDAIINTSQSGIFVFKPIFDDDGDVTDFRFTKANPTLASYVGQLQEALVGELGSRWFPAYKTNGLFDLYRHTYITSKTNRFDFHYNADGIDVWLDILSTKMDEEVLVTFTDYTSAKRLQLELEETVHELKRSNDNLEEFAYVASHDLQEPLRKIQYFSDRLKVFCNDEKDASGIISRMEDATNRMRILIEDLLAYSRFSFKSNTAETTDLNELVKEVISDLEAMAAEKKASITVHDLPVVTGDKPQLRQLLQNLISNAIKYNRNDVALEIAISSKIVEGSQFEEKLPMHDTNKKFCVIEITDNGIGFDPAYSKQIFKIFQRLHGRSEYPGTGVGLAIVQKVAENHKGFVFAESTPGKGATFKVLLPV